MTEEATTQVRTDVPPDYHPGTVGLYEKSLNIPGTVGPKALAAAKEALAVSYHVHGAINDAERQLRALTPGDAPTYVHGGKLLREHGSEEQLAAAAVKATERAVQTIDRRVNEIESYSNSLRAAVTQAIDFPGRNAPSGIAEGTEIRQYVRGLPESERHTFVHKAIAAGDVRTVAAVLHSPPYLSGFDQNTHNLIRATAEHKFAPVETGLLEGMSRAVDHLTRGSKSLQARTSEVTAIATGRAEKRKAALERLTK